MRSESINNPPPLLKFSVLGPSVRGKQGEPHRPMIPLTGSADVCGGVRRRLAGRSWCCPGDGSDHSIKYLSANLPKTTSVKVHSQTLRDAGRVFLCLSR